MLDITPKDDEMHAHQYCASINKKQPFFKSNQQTKSNAIRKKKKTWTNYQNSSSAIKLSLIDFKGKLFLKDHFWKAKMYTMHFMVICRNTKWWFTSKWIQLKSQSRLCFAIIGIEIFNSFPLSNDIRNENLMRNQYKWFK